MTAAGAAVAIGLPALDRMMPMCLVLDQDGRMRHIGPTLRKLIPGAAAGRPLAALFTLRRPTCARGPADLLAAGGRIALETVDTRVPLRGQAVALSGGGLILNLALGLPAFDDIEKCDLTAADFAATDLTVDLLYLIEAKAAVLRESQLLNRQLKEAKRSAEAQALTDALTGLGNRRAMDAALARMLGQGEPFGLLHLDLDRFKQVNDTFGHAAGDNVLVSVANILRAGTRPADVLVRVGGDEFLLLMRGVTAPAALADAAGRLIAGIARPISWQQHWCHVTASIGATSTRLYQRPAADRMLSDADAALYESKRSRRNCVTLAVGDGDHRG